MFIGLSAFFVFPVFADETDGQVWYDKVYSSVDPDTEKLLSDIGIDKNFSTDVLSSLSPENVINTVKRLFSDSVKSLLSVFSVVTVLLCVFALIKTFAGDGKTVEAATDIGILFCVFMIITASADIFTQCRNAIEITKDFMLSLLPVFTGIAAFSGNPATAASFNTVVFCFAQTVSVAFTEILPAVSVAGTAVGTASALSPVNSYISLCKIVSKAVNAAAAFIACIFAAVLSVKSVISGAADTVTLRGLRFLVGNSVPVVGSAIGDSLNSVVAGLRLVKNSVFALGVSAVVFISLPALIKLFVFGIMLSIISAFSQILSVKRIPEFTETVKNVLSVLAGVTFFNAFVYVISCAILITAKSQ